jgi:hypothetical protein
MQRRLILVTLFGVAIIVVTALNHTPKVHATSGQDHQSGCSVASLKGAYAFHLTGVNNGFGGPIAELGIDVFNGEGLHGPIRKTGSQNGTPVDWTVLPWPEGRYEVHGDCTGSLFGADGTKSHNIIVLDGGNRFSVVSLQPNTIVSGEGVRLDEKD